MITFLVGGVWPGEKVDVDTSQVWNDELPRRQVISFQEYLCQRPADCTSTTIRVYQDTLINWIGQYIELGDFNHEEVRVVTGFGIHTFSPDGILGGDWPYGIFNYS